MQHSKTYIMLFAAAVCAVCSVFVSSAAVLLKDRQAANATLDRQMKVLTVAGLMREGQRMSRKEVTSLFADNIQTQIVDLKSGAVLEGIDPSTFDQRRETAEESTSSPAPPNPAKVRRVPDHGMLYRVMRKGRAETIVIPITGKGLWSTLYGYLALDGDTRTIKGITFYEHGETPGLGGEVDNPRWKALWVGRKAFDDDWKPAITVKKGTAGPVDEDPYSVDGLSGATITSRGVSALVRFWLGDAGYGPYLASVRAGGTG